MNEVMISTLEQETFEKFRKLIFEATGIHMRDGKQILVANRLRRRVHALALSGYEEYYAYLTKDSRGRQEMVHFIDSVTTNETYFYRESNHLDSLRKVILPELFARRKRLVIWSAGCSTGEEPYTLRMELEEGQGRSWNGEIRIIGTDLSNEAVARAREGIYEGRTLELLPPSVKAKYFSQVTESTFQVIESVRRSVELRTHNLLKDPPPVKSADVIFCRNVMIYFTKETQKYLADDYFAKILAPDGYLCIGHSESLSATSSRFRYVRGMNAPVYQLVEG